MDWVTFSVQWLHVLLGIVWFGNTLALAIFFIPAISRLSITTQREIGAKLGERATPIIDVVAPAILVLGVIRGTLLGPIDSVEEVFSTAYGLTWLVALVVTVAVFLWGRIVIVGAVNRLAAAPLIRRWRTNAGAGGSAVPREAGDDPGAPRLLCDLHLHDPHALRPLTIRGR